jgi:hypothetical protein
LSIYRLAPRITLEHDGLMPRLMRIEYPGAIYHVMSRGDRREPIFLHEGARTDPGSQAAGLEKSQ